MFIECTKNNTRTGSVLPVKVSKKGVNKKRYIITYYLHLFCIDVVLPMLLAIITIVYNSPICRFLMLYLIFCYLVPVFSNTKVAIRSTARLSGYFNKWQLIEGISSAVCHKVNPDDARGHL